MNIYERIPIGRSYAPSSPLRPNKNHTYVHSASIKGKRPSNEDMHQACKFKHVNFYAVYDGHGGDEVSLFLHKNVPALVKKLPFPIKKRHLIHMCNTLQERISKRITSKFVGSTAIMVLHYIHNKKEHLVIMNIGDSRAILSRHRKSVVLSIDHKPNSPSEKLRIEEQGGFISYDGYDWRIKGLSLSRSFGDIFAIPYVTHKPDIFYRNINKSDAFIVLACDGLWDVMTNQSVVDFVHQHINKHNSINISMMLCKRALELGSTDNITVVIVLLPNH